MTYTETDFLDDLWEDVPDENGNEFDEDSEDTWNGMAEDAAMEGSLFGWEAELPPPFGAAAPVTHITKTFYDNVRNAPAFYD